MTTPIDSNIIASHHIETLTTQITQLKDVYGIIVWTPERLRCLRHLVVELDYLLDEIEDAQLD